MIGRIVDEGTALKQCIGKEPLQLGLYIEIKLQFMSGIGILIEEAVEIRIHPAEEDQGIERGAVLHGAGVGLGAANNSGKGAQRRELFFRGDIYIDQEVVGKLIVPAA